jgi:SAM-dependent methyltransferase
VLRALTGFGLFSQQADGRFALGPLGEGAAQLDSYPWFIAAVEELPRTVVSGTTGMQLAHGTSFFEFLAQHPEEGAQFDKLMTTFHAGEKEGVADAYDFSTVDSVVDVGGGNGTFMSAVLPRYEQLRGVLFDLPPVIERARPALARLGDRCEAVAGDFFDSVPAGHDAYVLSHIIHDWDEERALTVLRNCHEAMGPNGRLLLVESVVPPGDEPHPAKMLDMLMLVCTGGMERTEDEYADLLGRAGFRLMRVIPTASPVSVIEAVPTEERV